MSLFKCHDWWSTTLVKPDGGEEECDIGYLLVSNITNSDPPVNSIIVGGFSGSIRIYQPKTSPQEDGSETFGYSPNHLLLETTLNYPLLQIAVGKFVSGNTQEHLCALHKDRLSIFSVSVSANQTGQGINAKLTPCYQHHLQRHAHSLYIGSFGGVKGKDFIAVQSLDGCISIFEQESFAFARFLPGFLLPGPFVYVPNSDSFLTITSDWILQAYKYQSLAISASEDKNESAIKSGGRRLTPDWEHLVGEAPQDLQVIISPGGVTSILLLSLHSFMCFKDSGVLKFVKKLEYNPSSMTAYYIENHVMVCVTSHTKTLLVYNETHLKWASQLTMIPVSIQRAHFPGISGGLVMLSDDGELQVTYLGTDPSLFVAPPAETREINYEEADKELAQLHSIIKASSKDPASLLTSGRNEVDLVVTAAVGNQLEEWKGETSVNDPDGVSAVTMVVRLTAHTPLNCVRVVICVEKPLALPQNTFVLRTVNDTSQIMVKIYLADPFVPTSLNVRIVTSYIKAEGVPQFVATDVHLPLRLVVKPCPPNKEADNKITISTNKPAVNLPELFPEFGLDGSVSTAMGLQYFGGHEVTVLSSRTTHRYRLQSDCLAALWIILSEMTRRLESYWNSSSQGSSEEKLSLGITSSIPVQELFSEIDAHFLRRRKHKDLQAQLVQRATQFRAVQKRLLTKFKDKTPTPLTNLDNLLEGTYKQIIQITDVINSNLRGLQEDACQLCCVLRLMLQLLRLQCHLSEEQYKLLEAALSPLVTSNMEQGWEEVTDCTVTFLLRTVLGKGNRDAGATPAKLTMVPDTNKLKKHIGLLLDKITKTDINLSLNNKAEAEENKDPDSESLFGEEDEMMESHNHKASEPTAVPLGSRLGEDRARSARIRSARVQSSRQFRQVMGESVESTSTLEDINESQSKLDEPPELPDEADEGIQLRGSIIDNVNDASDLEENDNENYIENDNENDNENEDNEDKIPFEDDTNENVEDEEEETEPKNSDLDEVNNKVNIDVEELKKLTISDVIESPPDDLFENKDDDDNFW